MTKGATCRWTRPAHTAPACCLVAASHVAEAPPREGHARPAPALSGESAVTLGITAKGRGMRLPDRVSPESSVFEEPAEAFSEAAAPLSVPGGRGRGTRLPSSRHSRFGKIVLPFVFFVFFHFAVGKTHR